MKIATMYGIIAIIMIAITFICANKENRTEAPSEAQEEHFYPEVASMLANDSIMAIHRFWGIDTIYYYDWEESAFSLGVTTGNLTIEMYMDHMQHGASSKYVRNRAVNH